MLVAARSSKLEESIKLHQYIREADDVTSWLEEKQSLAASDDYGKDYDHLLVRDRKGLSSFIPHCLTGPSEEVRRVQA